MRRFIVGLFVLVMVSGFAFAQVNSIPGTPGGDAHFNRAYLDIDVGAKLPGQVSFQLPTVKFTLDPQHIVPNSWVTLRIAVRNTSDRAIVVESDPSGGSIAQYGFAVSSNPVTIAAGSVAWFEYRIRMPNEAGITAAMQQVGAGNVIEAEATLIARGVLPTGNSEANFGF